MNASAFELLSRPIQHALWDMQWQTLRPIQADAIQRLLTTDDDLLITARTASGKTEAAFLPILSTLYESPGSSVGAMYVGPLKALINDQFQRLERLCEKAEIPVHRWHGDVDAGKKEKLLKNPRGIVLITPESLESFFVNRPTRIAGLFADLRFVVIDEIHALVGRERGLQLRSQLFRLRRYTQGEFRLLGLSATVGDRVDFYRSWMRPDNPERVAHIQDEQESKRVQYGIYAYEITSPKAERDQEPDATDRDSDLDAAVPDALNADVLRNFAGRKNLIFCNSRGGVEWLADGLNDACRRMGRPEEFLVHHGSVSKELRFHTEDEMRGTRPATAVCSATLELGIDIGNVKTVGQLGSCWSVNSLVQRLGRSGRRDDEAHSMRVMLPTKIETAEADLVRRLYPELLQSIALTELMLERWYEPPDISVHDRSTFVQQVLSVLAENGGIQAKPLAERLVGQGAFREMELTVFAEVLRCLGRFGLIEQMNDGVLLLTPKGEQVVHDRDFYSAFMTPQELTVRCDSRTIGSLSAIYMPRPEDHFLLAGRRWQVAEVDLNRSEILVRPATGRKPPKFYGSTGEIHPRIHEEMRLVVSGEKEYAYLNELGKELLQAAREAYRQTTSGDEVLLDLGPGHCFWFTWAGTRIQRTLVLLAEQMGLDCTDDNIAIRFRASRDQIISAFRRLHDVPAAAEDHVFEIEPVPWRKFDEFLSQELLLEAFVHDRLDLPGARAAIAKLVSRYAAPTSSSLTASPSVKAITTGLDSYRPEHEDDDEPEFSLDDLPDGPLDTCEFVAFDLETTGLHPLWSRIVEIAAVRFHSDGRELARFQSLVNPGEPIPADATQIHGITDEMVRDAPPIQAALSHFARFVDDGTTVMLAHNASFDRQFLASAAAQHRVSLPRTPVIDTLAISRTLIPDATSHRLAILVERLGGSVSRAHRATFDADAVRFLFGRLLGIRLMRTRHELYQLGAVARLCESANLHAEVPSGYEHLISAIESKCRVQMLYRGPTLQPRLREVLPLQVISSSGRNYLSAICGFDGKQKLFRLDRIQKLIVLS